MMKKRIISLICIFSIVLGMTSEYVWAEEQDLSNGLEDTVVSSEVIPEIENVNETIEEQQSEELQETFETQESVLESDLIENDVNETKEENAILFEHDVETIETLDMYRLYNPNSGEHFYTSTVAERDHLVNVGWNYEGISWKAPVSGNPVYRLYNPNAGDHHYTLNSGERDYLVSLGWQYEGVGWYSDADKSTPIFRVYNPNAVTGTHHYTANFSEIQHLVSVGWNYEGIGWYSCDFNGAQTGNTGGDIGNIQKEYIEITNLEAKNGTFDVKIYLYREGSSIQKVYVPVWKNADQSDIEWYAAEKLSDGVYKLSVDMIDHQWKSGDYQVHCYVQNQRGEMKFVDSTMVSMDLGVRIEAEDLDEYSTRIKVYGVSARAEKVYFPSWSVVNDQDDVVWYEGKRNENTSWSADVHTKTHTNSGDFICDVYEEINGQMKSLGRVEFYIPENWEGRYIDPSKPMVALTFDDGPSAYTPRILDCLEEHEQAATFFVVGYNAARYGSTMKRMIELECEIGNHSYNHPDLTTMSYSGIVNEMASTNSLIYAATGTYATVSRTPGGSVNSIVRNAISTPIIMWSIDTIDWKTRDTWSTVNCVLNNVEDGDIVLMHDIHSPTIAAAEILIPELVKRGYQLVTVSELSQYRGNGMKAGNVYYSFK